MSAYDEYPRHEDEGPTRTWECSDCGETVERYRGQDDIQCECGAWYNTFGQRLRDDWQGNPSNYDENISDLEGFELQQLRREEEMDWSHPRFG